MEHTIEGRAITPEQKRFIIERLYAAWLVFPRLRLGQLIELSNPDEIYYKEDYSLLSDIEDHVTSLVNKGVK